MPIRVLECEKCKKQIENITTNINDNEPDKCECGGDLKRVFGANKISHVQFPGSYHNW